MAGESLRLSVLDQTPVGEGYSPAEALRASVELAQTLDTRGFTRYWVAEHHNSPGFAGTAPEILAGQLLARTRNLRVGTGGVLLPRYSAAKVAEVFQVLAALHPGRVDLGLGRAGGPAQRFPEQVGDVRRLLGMDLTGAPTGDEGPGPRMWLLGAGSRSAELAGRLGASFAFAHFLSPAPGRAALAAYRQELAEYGHPARTGVLAVRAVVADTAEKADELARSLLLWRSRKDLGEDLPLPSLETTRRHRWTGQEAERAAVNGRSLVYGTAEQVHARITELAAGHGVDEVVVNTLTHEPADRVRSYELLAEAFALTGGVRVPVGV
ncbi:MsnO8 family LLM class oxidoreductase [Streptomyces sp. NPDC091272]|uniref:MsnO8 family LLM class oxidoreductase n=1 Tax=Streptomyces sp. NPDC091272 TaxID=3365981 RepID=UPI0037F1E0E3